MKSLPADTLKRFDDGFGVQWKEEQSFTAVDIDHATEWVNGESKSTGGLSTITQNDSATLKYNT